ncbi:hypothetical protein WBJ53_08905 [Spirosoma sp. SC4-14]|uniref:hypothetical protein n=1 Tax=Spirosoma sp. SC4-14 TaxID=3128900 RepID=UPI0030CDEC06
MLTTICTIRQLPQALALGDSFAKNASETGGNLRPFVIGLADNPAHIPANFQSPYPIWPIGDIIGAQELQTLSAKYTPTEFIAACKPALLREIFRRLPDVDELIYADPNVQFFGSLAPVWQQLQSANILLTPHITQAPPETVNNDRAWPDEKFFQNIGLYSADFLAFKRSNETDRMLAWWQDRVQERAVVDFCVGLCTDQIWLMHVPVFFNGVKVIKEPGWHVAIWNLPQRPLYQQAGQWILRAGKQPLLFANFKGLYTWNEGFFPHQNRLNLKKRSELSLLMANYRNAVAKYQKPDFQNTVPAYGQQPEPIVLRGWRRASVQVMRAVTTFVNQVPLPVLR